MAVCSGGQCRYLCVYRYDSAIRHDLLLCGHGSERKQFVSDRSGLREHVFKSGDCSSGLEPDSAAPTGLTVGALIATNVPLDWRAPTSQVGVETVSYSVWRCSQSSCPRPPKIATVDAPLSAYTDTGCIPKVGATQRICYYEVRANDLIAGVMETSAPSNIVKAIVQ